jgi:predicted membrane channel-forming protein YqfA (hemolysin III family)
MRKPLWALAAAAVLCAVVLAAWPRIPQEQGYHQFADTRTVLGVPNGLNVLSNVPFAVVGLAGIALLVRRGKALRDPRERWPWMVFFVGVAFTSLGSAWYHLAPSNASLVWDRCPMAIGFMALLSALITERIDARLGLWLLAPLVLLGLAGVLAWNVSERAGAGDLRLYVFVQFFPLVAIPLILWMTPRTYGDSWAYLVGLGVYALAKVAEVGDGTIYEGLGGLVSGHTLKHLIAAAAVGVLAWAMAVRVGAIRPARTGAAALEPPGPTRASVR